MGGAQSIVVKLADKQAGAAQGAGGGASMRTPAVVPPPSAKHVPPPGGAANRLYVKGLPAGMTDQAVAETFSSYGVVADAKVLVADGKSDDGTGQSVAIVRYETELEAQWVVENLNGNIPQGLARSVDVSFASKGQGGGGANQAVPYRAHGGGKGAGPGSQWAAWAPTPAALSGGKGGGKHGAVVPSVTMLKNECTPGSKLYIKGLPMGADDLYLYKVFSPWARLVEAVAVSKQDYTIGFVTCLTDAEAMECINNVNGVTLTDGATLQVAVKTVK